MWKTDPAGNVIPTGASFALYHAADFDDSTQTLNKDVEPIIEGTTGNDGILDLEELAEGEYRLVETEAPAGYNRLDSAIKITVTGSGVTAMQGDTPSAITVKGDDNWVEGQDEGTSQIRVWNNPGVELPSTGGPGTWAFTVLGGVLILGAGALLWRRQRSF